MPFLTTIRRTVAFLLLLVFAFSATPKCYLHDLVADHTDTPAAHHHAEGTWVGGASLDCHCEDLVVSTPFLEMPFHSYDAPVSAYNAYIAASYQRFSVATRYARDLRGPPAAA